MSCNSNGNCNRHKSFVRYYNQTAQAFAANATHPIVVNANQVVSQGKAIVSTPNGYRIERTGLYGISADVVILGTTAGNVTVQANLDDVALPCTIRYATLVVDGYVSLHLETDILFEQVCKCQNNTSHQITFSIVSTGGAGSIVEVCTGIIKR